MLYKQAMDLVDAIDNESYDPTDWENKFMEDITIREDDLTPRQSETLNKIYCKSAGDTPWERRQSI